MFFIQFDRGVYAYTFLAIVMCLFGFAVWEDPSTSTILETTLVAGSFPFCMTVCDDKGYGYLAGLKHLARRHGGPFVNVTAFLFALLFGCVHIMCIVIGIIGLFLGREVAVRLWSKLTERDLKPNARETVRA